MRLPEARRGARSVSFPTKKMNSLPSSIHRALLEALGTEPTRARSLGGGMINDAASVEVSGTRYFVKWNGNAPSAFFEVEARGLALLRATNTLRVPQVIAHSESSEHAPAYLILEWIESAPNVESRAFLENLGRSLAALHRVTGAAFGLDHHNYIGSLPQQNTQSASWPEFFRDQRIAAQMEIARKLGHLPPHRESLLRKLIEQIETLVSGSGNPPSLIHGDLWPGNFLAASDGRPAVVDPAIYYGDREVEIAYTELFGGFPTPFLEAYREAYPLDLGYEYRRPLLQLYPLLVHLNHFGETYGGSVEAVCQHYITS
jgi:fructosamine-3-kinase